MREKNGREKEVIHYFFIKMRTVESEMKKNVGAREGLLKCGRKERLVVLI